MVTINIVQQNGHAWTETCENKKAAKRRATEAAKQYGDVERVELLTETGPEDIYTSPYERKSKK